MPPAINIKGQRFGKLIAVRPHQRGNRIFWEFRCDCGKTRFEQSGFARAGRIKSCGCENLPEERFWSLVDKNGDVPSHCPWLGRCWNFTGNKTDQGYGRFYDLKHHKVLAHRFAFELKYSKIKRGRCVLHRCDNPSCVRWSHLFEGSVLDNVRDMFSKRRQAHSRLKDGTEKFCGPSPAECSPLAKYSNEQIVLVRSLSSAIEAAQATGMSEQHARAIRRGAARRYG